MAEPVELSVRSKLMQIVEELDAIQKKSEETTKTLEDAGKKVGESHEKQTRKTETYLGKLSSLSKRIASSIVDDFKVLMGAAGISEGLKLGSTFRDSIKESFALTDSIRKLGGVFGIAESRFAAFQTKLTQGLGDIGLSSEAAVNALKGLSETQVRGEGNLQEYSKLAGQLASISGTKGREGDIAKGIASTITARGGNVNDIKQAQSVAQDLQKAFLATGKAPTEVLSALEELIAKMPQDLRKAIGTKGLINLGVTSAIGGPNATKFLEEYLGKSPIARKALEARGFGGVFGAQGLNVEKFKRAASGVINAFPGDPRLMAQTLGLSEDAAEGFIRLYESLDKVSAAQEKMNKDNRTIEQQYYASMTASEAFSASLNRVKSSLAKPIAFSADFITSGLQKAFRTSLDDVIGMLPESIRGKAQEIKKGSEPFLPEVLDKSLGATGVVAGAGLVTTLLAGGGLKSLLSLGRGKATGIAERAAFEQITGGKVQDVYVVNAQEIGQASSAGPGKSLGVLGWLGKAGMVAGAAAGGLEIGSIVSQAIAEGTQGTTSEGFTGDIIERAMFKIDQLLGGVVSGTNVKPATEYLGNGQTARTPETPTVIESSPRAAIQNFSPAGRGQSTAGASPQPFIIPQDVRVRVTVDTKNKDLKALATPTRGATQ